MDIQSQPNLAALHDDDLVDEATACRMIGGSSTPIHRSTWWRGIKEGRYPKPLKVSPSANRWRVGELRNALNNFAAQRGAA